jgi:hypothetical protein
MRRFPVQPPLADCVALQSAGLGASELAIKLLARIRPDLYASTPRGKLERRARGDAFRQLQAELETAEEQLADLRCPSCKALLAHRTPAPLDDAQKHWDEIDVFECGYEVFGGTSVTPAHRIRAFRRSTILKSDIINSVLAGWRRHNRKRSLRGACLSIPSPGKLK